jgi:spermidine synthase
MFDVTSTDIHLQLIDCSCNGKLLTDGKHVTEIIVDAVKKSDLTVVETCYKEFDNGGGITAAVLLLESHVVIHTWPDRKNTVIADISVCNYSLQEVLVKVFSPEKTLINMTCNPISTEELELKEEGYDIRNFLDIEDLIMEKRSPYQEIKVVKSRNLGNVLILDNIFQTSERDEFFYHEPLVHVPLITHENPTEVLIIGGGDGGAAEEVLKHPSVERCVMVELDGDVFEAASKYLNIIHRNVFQNDRLKFIIKDGSEYLKEYEGKFDVIILDLTDPIGKSIPLYSAQFYQALKEHLNPDGLVSLHMGIITHDPRQTASTFKNLIDVFAEVKPYLNYVPLYGGMISFGLCGTSVKLLSADEVVKRINLRNIERLELFNGDVYRSMFALPNYVKKILGLTV